MQNANVGSSVLLPCVSVHFFSFDLDILRVQEEVGPKIPTYMVLYKKCILNKVTLFMHLIATLFNYHYKKDRWFSWNSFYGITLNVNLDTWHLCIFSVEWWIDITQSSYKSCKIGLVLKFRFEIITSKLSHQMNPPCTSGSLKLRHLDYLNTQSFFFQNRIYWRAQHS